MMNAKTFAQKPAEVTRQWIELDATRIPLGRLATTAANYLIGKHKPTYTAHVDGGDYVIITNARQVAVTGNKAIAKIYYRHTGFPGGIKSATYSEQLEKNPTKIIEQAVRGMLPKNKLLDGRLKRLKVYADDSHNHAAQKPIKKTSDTSKTGATT